MRIVVAVGFADQHDAQAGFAVLDRRRPDWNRWSCRESRPLRGTKTASSPPGSSTRAVANMPGFSAAFGFSKRASRMKTRELGSTDGLMAMTLPWNSRSGIRGDARHHRHRRVRARGALFRRLQLQLQGADADDGRDLVGQRDVFAGGHRARGDVAIEGRADGGIGQRLFRPARAARARHRATPAKWRPLRSSGARRWARLRIAVSRRWPARRRFPAGCGLFRRRCAKRRRLPPDWRSAGRRPRPAGPGPAPIRSWPCAAATSGTLSASNVPLRIQADARLRLAHGGGGFLQLRARLVEPQLRVAMVEFADHLALLDELAHIDGRGDHPARRPADAMSEVSSAMNVPVSSKPADTWRSAAGAVETATTFGAALAAEASADCFEPHAASKHSRAAHQEQRYESHFDLFSFFGSANAVHHDAGERFDGLLVFQIQPAGIRHSRH